MTDYQFTQDWFHWAPEVWERLVPLLPEGHTFGAADRGVRHFLEVGSFEGRSAVWMIEHMMRDGDMLKCIDTWTGGEDHTEDTLAGAEERFDSNTALARKQFPGRHVSKWKGTSLDTLAEEVQYGKGLYAFIYIDGSHVAKDVLTDACLAWPLLQPGGLMVFDDYLWGEPRDILHRPKPAVDAFVNLFAEEIDVVHVGYQMVVRKKP